MIRCYHCGTDNLDGSEYCDECGTKLNAAAGSPKPGFAPPPSFQSHQSPMSTSVAPQAPVPPPPPSFTRDAITPKPATPYTPPPPPVYQSAQSGQSAPATQPPAQSSAQPSIQAPPPPSPSKVIPLAVVSVPPAVNTSVASLSQTTNFNGTTGNLRSNPYSPDSGQQPAMNVSNQPAAEAPTVRAKLIIQRGGKVGKEFPIVGIEALIGRWDADGGIFPDVDLDQDDPEAKVSRRHARIQFLNNQYLIEDLGSTNGTFINRGPRLLPGIKQPLNNGDEIIVGKTFLKFLLN
ncbi:MAG: FHA domain-containing protein [Acidobacteriota bacterium]